MRVMLSNATKPFKTSAHRIPYVQLVSTTSVVMLIDVHMHTIMHEQEIVGTLGQIVEEQKLSSELVVSIIYKPQATFRVTAVTRCSGTLPGHTEVR